MTYLLCYLALGVVILAVIIISDRFSQAKESQEFRKSIGEVQDALFPERKKLWYRLLNNIIAPGLAGVLLIVGWPVALIIEARKKFLKERKPAAEENVETLDLFSDQQEKEFAVERGDLQERLSLQEIEQRERVTDPLGAVPDLPFGHLNGAWRKFLESKSPEDEVWTFSAHWTTSWGQKELRAGYVIVRGDGVGPYFQTVGKILDGA